MIKYTTYFALPVLRSYNDALIRFDNVVPIRGDKDNTKPAGRRDQKFFCIWKGDDQSVNLGYRGDKDKPLIKFDTNGVVAIKTRMSASCRERVERILGVDLVRKHNRTWVQAKTYQDGKEVDGWFPISDPKDSWQSEHREALFIMSKGGGMPMFLNPTPVNTYTKCRHAAKVITAKYKAFRSYVENIAELIDGQVPVMPTLELRALLDLSAAEQNDSREIHLCPRYSYNDVERHAKYRARFFELLESGDTEDMYKAMLWVSASGASNGDWRHIDSWCLSWERTVIIHHRDTLFPKTQSRDGVLRGDRYAKVFSAV